MDIMGVPALVRCNDNKLAVILRDSPDITIGDSGHYGSPCFQFDGVNVSSKLSSPTKEASVTAALREIEYRTRPAELKRRGWEMDHMMSPLSPPDIVFKVKRAPWRTKRSRLIESIFRVQLE